MTIKLTDVAKKAGVSPTTVSRVINRRGYISEDTIAKVEQAMEELNYQPNNFARSLQGKESRLIGLIFPSVSNPFYGELIEHLENAFFEQGYKCILCNSQNKREKERDYIKMLTANKVDGIIAGAHNLGIEEYHQMELPIVSFDRFLARNIPIVSSDNYQGGELATKALIQSGAKHIGIITGANDTNSPTIARLGAFVSTMEEFGLEPHVYRFPKHYTQSLRTMHIRQILTDEKLDGLFCTDDFTAINVMNEAKSIGIRIPEDLKLIGFDGTQFVQQFFPQLATIVQPLQDEASLLVDMLVERIQNPTAHFENYELPNKIQYGETL